MFLGISYGHQGCIFLSAVNGTVKKILLLLIIQLIITQLIIAKALIVMNMVLLLFQITVIYFNTFIIYNYLCDANNFMQN